MQHRTFERTPRSDVSTGRRWLVRIPAFALVMVLTAAWAPCLACERPTRVNSSLGLVTAASCHGIGATGASSCAPLIRAAGPALRASGIVPMAGPTLLPPPLLGLRALRPVAAWNRLPGLAPLQRPPLYLLHASLLD